MKKIICILTAALLVLQLASCSKNSEPTQQPDKTTSVEDKVDTPSESTVESSDDATADDVAGVEADYEASMNEFIAQFETLTGQVSEMLTNFEDSEEWYKQFAEIYADISSASETLAEITAQVPESYQESHVNITVAVAAYADMMNSVGSATDAYKSGDEAKGDELMATAQGLYEGAIELWAEAVK